MKSTKLFLVLVLQLWALRSMSQNHNYALNFDGSDDYIQLGQLTGIDSTSNTLELWIKVPVVGTGGLTSSERVGIILGGYNSTPHFNYEITTNGRPRVYWNNGEVNLTASSTYDVRDGKWHHLAYVRDVTNNFIKIFLDGNEIAASTSAGTNINMTVPQRIGRDNRTSGTTHNFHGSMDELRIWDYAKSETEIRASMCSTVDPNSTGLLSYYNFNVSSDTFLIDQTGTLGGNLQNFGFTGNVSNWFVSDAPFGDVSVYDYAVSSTSVITMTTTQNGVFEVSNISGSTGTTEGVHIYRIDSVPNYTDSLMGNIAGNDAYFGVFQAGLGTSLVYDVELDYTNMFSVQTAAEPFTILLERSSYADSTWANSAATLDVTANTIEKSNVTTNKEFMIGQGQSLVAPPTSLFDNALNFDGDNDYIQLNQSAGVGDTSNTVELWLKVPEVGTGGLTASERVGIVLGGYNSNPHFNYEITTGGVPRVYWNGGQVNLSASSVDLRDGKWHHLAYVRDVALNQFLIYVDGVEVASSTSAGSDLVMTVPQRIGRDNRTSTPTHNLHGTMDELRIWNVAKTETEIRQSMCSRVPLNSNGLVSYFDFNVSAGSSILDQVGPLNGTLNGFALTGDTSNWIITSAPVGDQSVYEYAPSTATALLLSSATNGNFEVSNVTGSLGATDGIHIYRRDTVPNYSDSMITNIPNNNAYFGVFEAGISADLTFDVKYDYNNVAAVQGPAEHLTLLMEREHYADSTWLDAAGTLSTPQNIITRTGDTATAEFILGQDLLPPPPPPFLNNSFSFDGEDDFIQMANPLNVGEMSHTFELWLKVPMVNTDGLDPTERVGIIIGTYNDNPNFNYEIHNEGTPRIYWNGAEVNATANSQDLRDNRWHHLAFVRDVAADSFKIYIDGEVVLDLGTSGTDIDVQTIHRIGGDNRSTDGGPSFHGQMDEIRIWSKAKTTQEIREGMCHKLTGSEADLLTYYPFDGQSIADLGSAANNGSFTNVNSTDPRSGYRVSGAPVGDESAYLHTNNFANQSVTIGSLTSNFTVDSITGFIDGVHVYRVDTLPHSDSGIYNLGNQSLYYGVFVSQVGVYNSLNYNAVYDYSGDANAVINENNINLYARASGDLTPWVLSSAIQDQSNDVLVVNTPSGRGEYILADYSGNPCSIPTNVDIDNVELTTADISWTTSSPETKVQYGTTGFSLGSGTQVSSTTGSYSFSGLLSETGYEFYLGDSCSATGQFVWVGPFVFATKPLCPFPDIFEVSTLTDSSAILNVVTSGTNTEWVTSHGPVGFNVDFGIQRTHNSTPIVLDGLNELTSYEVYIRADCDSLYSDWFGPLTFTTDSVKSDSVIGIPTVEENGSDLQVFPNPATSEINLKFTNSKNNESYTVVLYNMTGVEVQRMDNVVGDGVYKMPVKSTVSSGLYLLKVVGGKGVYSQQIVIRN